MFQIIRIKYTSVDESSEHRRFFSLHSLIVFFQCFVQVTQSLRANKPRKLENDVCFVLSNQYTWRFLCVFPTHKSAVSHRDLRRTGVNPVRIFCAWERMRRYFSACSRLSPSHQRNMRRWGSTKVLSLSNFSHSLSPQAVCWSMHIG